MYIYISINTFILEQGRWFDLKQDAKSIWKSAPKKSAMTWNRTWTWKKCDINRLQWFRMETARCASPGLLGAHCSLALSRVTLQTLGLWAQPRFPEKYEKKGPWLMVPYGTRSDEKCSRIHIYKRVMVPWVVRNSPNIMSISIHRFINPVDRSRSISTVDKDSPTGEYGRYRRSIRIHLQRITVDRLWWIK